MRCIEQFKILVTGSFSNKNITIWSLPYLNELNKATIKYDILSLEIVYQSNDKVHIITGDNKGFINIWNVEKIYENKFSIDFLTSF